LEFLSAAAELRAIRPNSITLSIARELARQLVCDLVWLNSIALSRSQTWSQTWFSTCRRQDLDMSRQLEPGRRPVQVIFHYAILLAIAGLRPARDLVASGTA